MVVTDTESQILVFMDGILEGGCLIDGIRALKREAKGGCDDVSGRYLFAGGGLVKFVIEEH